MDNAEIVKEEVKDTSDMTKEERAELWEKWVRSEVNAALDIFLPQAVQGDIGLSYVPSVVEVLESGPVYSDTKADKVRLFIELTFENPINFKE
jgi:hypothetical protein